MELFEFMETWKDVENYEGIYQVSNYGRVRSLDRTIDGRTFKGIIMKQWQDEKGYLKVTLRTKDSKKNFFTHRLVAKAFIDNPDNKREVNHMDSDRKNNWERNLHWCTSKENAEHAKTFGKLNKQMEELHS